MELLLIGVGGAAGGLARFRIGKMISENTGSTFPFGTFVINITGALLLGLLTGAQLPECWYLLLGTGFLGAYTTFSTFMYEGFQLFQDNEKRNAVLYIACSLVFGITGYFTGFLITGSY